MAGFGNISPNDILQDVSFVLVEPVVSTILDAAPVSQGMSTCTPGSMKGIYPGAMLVAGVSGPEVITVVSVTAATFSADFEFDHPAGDLLRAATFPSGQPDHPLFTQTEMLGYLADVQNDFLLQVRPIYAVGSVTLKRQIPVYSCPNDAIRMERISIGGREMSNIAKTDADWLDPGLDNSSLQPVPDYWYQDGVNVQKFGLSPTPQRADTAEVFYSQRAGSSLGLADGLLVPDPMTVALKYGVLARALSKDGEQRDPQKAAFCQRWYDFIVFISQKYMQGVYARMKKDEETVEPGLAAVKG